MRPSVSAAAKSSSRSFTRSRPARWKAASWARSGVTIRPAWVSPPVSPAGCQGLSTSTGFSRAAARAEERKRAASSTSSSASRIARVRPSCPKWSRQSARSTSAAAPSVTAPEKPTSRRAAQARTPAAIELDCATRATPPASGTKGAKLALRRRRGATRPIESGPSRRMPARRAAAPSACASDRSPSATSTPAQPRRPAAAMTCAAPEAGAITRSTGCASASKPGTASNPSALPPPSTKARPA